VANGHEEEREREKRDRVFEILKHASTLNVATLILLVALLRDFSPEGVVPGAPSFAVGLFGISLLVSVFALGFFPLSSIDRRLDVFLYLSAFASLMIFLTGVFFALVIGTSAV